MKDRRRLTVTAAALVSIAVTPATPSIAKGTTQQFTATGTFSDSSDTEPDEHGDVVVGHADGSDDQRHRMAKSAGVGAATITATSGSVSSRRR